MSTPDPSLPKKAYYSTSLSSIVFRLLGLALLDAFALWFIYQLLGEGGATSIFLAIVFGIATIGVNAAFLREDLYPFRWFSPGLTLMALLVVYPVALTFYAAFTNYGTGHLLIKEQVISQLEKELYLPEGGPVYSWVAFRSEDGDYLVWFIPEDGDGFLAAAGVLIDPAEVNAGPLDADGIPESIPGYERLARGQTLRFLTELSEFEFGDETTAVRIRSMDAAAPLQPRYVYDAAQDTITDQETGTVYTPQNGTFTSASGEELRPGYYVVTGLSNFQRLFISPALRGPFLRIFAWTAVYALLVVLTTFALGLFFAIVFNDNTLPGRKLIRSLLLIPYAIPAFISVQMWRGLLNPQFGVISTFINDLIGYEIPWFSDQWWAKIGIILVKLWLGFPYMMLICTGALQAIPADLYQAAEVDGATTWQKFRHITLPLLLVAVGPLLIGSFAYNFNDFTVIDIYNEGGPPIPNTPTPAGHTDILISYTYRLAFAGGRGVDYGYASAITIVIFITLAIITALQFRYTRAWEEVSENV